MKRLLFLAAALCLSAHALAQNPRVDFRTSKGSIVVELYPDKAPRSVANFLQYVRAGFYDGTIFHRVIDGFMIQGGGFTREMREKPTRDPIQNEAGNGLKNDAGTIAMARRPNPHSATAQFYINLVDNDALNQRDTSAQGFGYAVFGKVVQGLDIVKAIAKVPTGRVGQFDDVPREPIVIQSATVEGDAAKK